MKFAFNAYSVNLTSFGDLSLSNNSALLIFTKRGFKVLRKEKKS